MKIYRQEQHLIIDDNIYKIIINNSYFRDYHNIFTYLRNAWLILMSHPVNYSALRITLKSNSSQVATAWLRNNWKWTVCFSDCHWQKK